MFFSVLKDRHPADHTKGGTVMVHFKLSGRLSSVVLAAALIAVSQWPQPAAASHILGVAISGSSVDSVTRTVSIFVTESTTGTGTASFAHVGWGDTVTSSSVAWTTNVPGSPAHYGVAGVTHVYPDLTDRTITVTSDCCTTGGFDLTTTVSVQVGCSDTPMGLCTAATGAQFQLKNDADNTKDKLKYKWAGTSSFAAHDPTGTTDYRLCVYAAGAIVIDTVIPPGAPKWVAAGSGFKYTDKPGTVFGVTKIKLKDGKIQVKGAGATLPDPTMPLTEPVVVQVQTSDGACFGGTLPATTKNTADFYKSKL
jgi:hypothetical protein